MDVVHSRLSRISISYVISTVTFTAVLTWQNDYFLLNYSLGLYQWSDKVVRKVERQWNVRNNKVVRHTVYLLVTPRVVVSILELLRVSFFIIVLALLVISV